ncbi:MAG: hypothetical protein ACT4QG_09150 [Sporichthyaceae bacterium]
MSATGRWQSEANLSAALLVAQARLGENYAGSVIDNKAQVWNLYSTADVSTSTMTAIRKAATRPIRVKVVKVSRNYEELLRIQQLVVDLARTPAGRSINGTSIKPADNQVRVDLDPSATNALVAQVLGMAPVGAIQVGNLGSYFSAEGDRTGSETGRAGDRLGKAESNLDGRPPYKAGKEVRMIGASTIQGSEGFVNEENVAGPNKQGDFIYSGATCATYSSSGGDSGAPIYQWNGPDTAVAFGMHFAVRFIDGEPEGGCFVRIPLIERAASVQLLTR